MRSPPALNKKFIRMQLNLRSLLVAFEHTPDEGTVDLETVWREGVESEQPGMRCWTGFEADWRQK